MPTRVWDNGTPVGSTTPARNIDEIIRDLKLDLDERTAEAFGDTFTSAGTSGYRVSTIITKIAGLIFRDPTNTRTVGTIQEGQNWVPVHNAGTITSAATIDWNNGNQQRFIAGLTPNLSFSNVKSGANYKLFITPQAGFTGNIILPAGYRYPGNVPVTLPNNVVSRLIFEVNHDASVVYVTATSF